jgi:Reverse transcriptase (RNA-dependent DNA polymerase)/gag-polypeptide of LTR copia-type
MTQTSSASTSGSSTTSSNTTGSSLTAGSHGEFSTKIIPFTGKGEDWESWKTKFQARAMLRGYEAILMGDETAPKTHTAAGVKLQNMSSEDKELMNANQRGFVDLILSMENTGAGKIALKIVMGTKTDPELPGGSLRVAYLRLKNKYEPSTEPQLVLINKKFHSTTMKHNQDPDIFITDLEAMKTKMCDLGHKIDEKTLILHIMNNLTPEYATEVRFLEQRMQMLKEAGKELTVEDVRNQLTIQYIRLKHSDKPTLDHAMYMGTRFKGKCHFCGKIGHKATECHQKRNGNHNKTNYQRGNGNGNGNHFRNRNQNGNENPSNGHGKPDERQMKFCTYCKKKGHQEFECRKKKRDNNVSNEQMNMVVSELACMAFEIANDPEDYPTIGSCVSCGRWGPAHVECGYCGEDSGCIYVPDSSVDYNDPTQEPQEFDEQEDTEDEDKEDDDSEIGYEDINDVTEPTYVTKFYPIYNDVRHNGLFRIPLAKMFSMVAQHYPIRADKQELYISDRVRHMNKFGLYTVQSVLKNLDYLSFNAMVHNEQYAQHIKRSQRPAPIYDFHSKEVFEIARWGTYLIEEYVQDMVQPLTYDPHQDVVDEVATTTPALLQADETPAEYSCAMMNRPWNAHRQRHYTKAPPRSTATHNHQQPPMTLTAMPQSVDMLMSMQNPHRNSWLADSGASCHFTNISNLRNSHTIHEVVQTGDGHKAVAIKQGELTLEVQQKNGTKSIISLSDCKYIPNLPLNLFSITQALSKKWKLGNRGVHIPLTRDTRHGVCCVVFDQVLTTVTGFLMTATMVPVAHCQTEMMFKMATRSTLPFPSPYIKPYHKHHSTKPLYHDQQHPDLAQIVTTGLQKSFRKKPVNRSNTHSNSTSNSNSNTRTTKRPTPKLTPVQAAQQLVDDAYIIQQHNQFVNISSKDSKNDLGEFTSTQKIDVEDDGLVNPVNPSIQYNHENESNHVPLPDTMVEDEIQVSNQDDWVSVPIIAKKPAKRLFNAVPAEIDINTYHKILGHVNERYLRTTAKYHNITLIGKLQDCVECALAKMHMKPISKETVERSKIPGERIFIDISHFPKPSMANSKYWLLILDDATDMIFSIFLKNKSDSPEHIIAFLRKMKDRGTPVKYIRLDNSGENNSLRDQTKDLDITYEFTAPNTPQQNGRVERKFAVLCDCVRSLINSAKLPEILRQKCWAEAANHATDILNGTCTINNVIPPYKLFYDENPPYYKYLRTFGEITVTSTLVNKKISAKTANRGTLSIYLGRAQNHSSDSYRLLKLDTMKVIISRNVKFTNLTYADYYQHNDKAENRFDALSDNEDEDDDKESIAEIQFCNDLDPLAPNPGLQGELEPPIQIELPTTTDDTIATTTPHFPKQQNSKLIRELRKLDGFYNPEVQQVLGSIQSRPTNTTMTTQSPMHLEDDQPNTNINITLETTMISDIPTDVPIDTHELSTPTDTVTDITPTAADTTQYIRERAMMMMNKQSAFLDMILAMTPVQKSIPNNLTLEQIKNQSENPFAVPMSQLKDILTVPTTFEDAYFEDNAWCRYRWRQAIKLELDKMEKLKVWHVVDRKDVPQNRRLIKNKWVFDIKRTGIFRARLVTCGYSQIPGVDFQDYYSPVVNDAVFRIVIILQILWNLTSVIIDVETAFLHGELNESIYMLPPKGTNITNNQCVHLDKALYGLVQAARQFYIKFANVLKDLQFNVSYADPCLFYRDDKHGKIILVIHIDDCYVVGDPLLLKCSYNNYTQKV